MSNFLTLNFSRKRHTSFFCRSSHWSFVTPVFTSLTPREVTATSKTAEGRDSICVTVSAVVAPVFAINSHSTLNSFPKQTRICPDNALAWSSTPTPAAAESPRISRWTCFAPLPWIPLRGPVASGNLGAFL